VRFNSDWAGYDPEFESAASLDADAAAEPLDGMPFSISVSVGPYASVILSQDE
jgi:1,4-alpha-glucan branching enzyme